MLPLLAGYAAAAAERMTTAAHDYLESGAGEEVSVGEAEAAWRAWRFLPRTLQPVPAVSTAVHLMGVDLHTPVLVAPTAHHRLAHPDGERATGAGVAAAGSLMVVSTRLTVPLEEFAATMTAPWWWQSYVLRGREVTAALAERATAAGARAIVLTGDTPYVGRRSRGVSAPLWVSDDLALVNVGQHLAPGADLELLQQSTETSLADIGWLAGLTGLPVLVKGVLRPEDALRCLDAGAAGLIVSNHGGRQLDRAVPTAQALTGVVDAVAGSVPVLVDGGIRSGLDALVALSLGADAVLLGRPVVWGLAADGVAGVAGVLDAVTDDLGHAMGLLGVESVADLNRSFLLRPEEQGRTAGRGEGSGG